MRFRLRTLLILLAVLPPLLAVIGVTVFGLKQEPPSVFGRVTYRGKPVELGTVEFAAQFGDGSSYAVKTDAEGCYRLDSTAAGRPLRPGSYRVTIDWTANGSPSKLQLVADLRPESESQINFDLQ